MDIPLIYKSVVAKGAGLQRTETGEVRILRPDLLEPALRGEVDANLGPLAMYLEMRRVRNMPIFIPESPPKGVHANGHTEPTERSHTTHIPNVFLEWVAPALSEGQLRVMLYLFRRTIGHHKLSDSVSLTQLCEGMRRRGSGEHVDAGTGMHRKSVLRAIDELVALGLIERVGCPAGTAGHATNIYRVRPEQFQRFVKGAK